MRHALQGEHREEDDANTQRRNHSRLRDLRSSLIDGVMQRLALLQISRYIFDRYGSVIDENPNCESQSAERHHIDRFAQEAKDDYRRQDRQRNRDRDDDGAAPASQKDEDHDRRKNRRDDGLADDAENRGANKDG